VSDRASHRVMTRTGNDIERAPQRPGAKARREGVPAAACAPSRAIRARLRT